MLILDFAERTGAAVAQFEAVPGTTSIKLALKFDQPAELVGFRFTLEQSLDGQKWWLLGGAWVHDVRTLAQHEWTLHEQLLRANECARLGFAAARDYTFRDENYRQLALCPSQRLTVETTGPLKYSIDASVGTLPLPQELLAILEAA